VIVFSLLILIDYYSKMENFEYFLQLAKNLVTKISQSRFNTSHSKSKLKTINIKRLKSSDTHFVTIKVITTLTNTILANGSN